jgi:hypothetical protein
MAKMSVKTSKLSALRMPGFNAGASLYDPRRRYRMGAGPNAGAPGDEILPQGFFCLGAGDATKCYLCDDQYGGCYQVTGHGAKPALQ